jgi:hypothetical protein
MNGNDIAVLLGLLAASIALAGFAGIVTSIDRGAAVASNEVISFRVKNLVTFAVVSVVLSLVPILIDGLELSSAKVSLLAARLRMRDGKDAGLSRSLFAINVTFGALGLGVQAIGALGLIASRGAYFVGLFYLLFVMCTLFHRMVAMADAAASHAAAKKK